MLKSRWTKVFAFLLCLVPFGHLVAVVLAYILQPDLSGIVWRFLVPTLPPNPLDFFTHLTGNWTLRLIVVTLSITPLRKLLAVPELIRFRRMIGLFAFFYGCLHFLTYLWFDKLFDFHAIWKDVGKRPFITAGFTAFVCMVPLALTSTKGWIRRLGGKRWQRLHRLIYVTAVAGVVHYYWLVKSDIRLPMLYGALVAVLLLYRMVVSLMKRSQQRTASAKPVPAET
ncbi:MAG TPA: protein-methionine-sulfoxide reductase heme-binding subunit MsrQ [Bryobacteraceae bacterium]|jgi:sulfoxide reductase heme-binding subunit YedZ